MFTFEGRMNGIFGTKGINWRDPEPGELANNQSVEPLYAVIPNSPVNNSWGAGAQYWDTVANRDAWVQSPDIYTDEGYEHRLLLATDLYNGKESPDLFPFWAVWPDLARADEVSMQRTNIVDYVNQNALAFVTGSKDLDTDWDAYVQGLDGLGFADYLASMQESYDATFR